MRLSTAAVVLAACGGSTAEPDAAPPDGPPGGPGVVMTDRGAVRGVLEGDVWAWRGIPYAAPPIGERRWRVPEPMPAWTDVRDASAWRSGCVAITTSGALIDGSEDCLYLNVWASAEDHQGPLPVLVFVHGGFSLNGSSSLVVSGERVYDGAYVAGHGPAVVVTLNYRLGALGNFTHDALAAESPTGSSGNYGLHDQVAALRWIQANIAAFGGDPAHVLLFGESAGGASTCALYTSPRAAGLFSAALVESAGCVAKPADRARTISDAMVAGAGCAGAGDVLACLRAVPADAIAVAAAVDLTQPQSERWTMSIDGDLIPEDPAAVIAAGTQQPVPLVIGTTSNEYSTLIGHFLAAPIATEEEYRAAVARFFPVRTDLVLARYPSSAYPSRTQALITLMTDAYMTCPTRRLARAAAASRPEAVRRYVFAHTYSNGPLAALGAGHALDVPFELHNLALTGFTPSAAELALSDAIIGYWVRFAATGDPNAAGAVDWPRYDVATDPAIILDAPITSTSGVRTAECDFWDG